MAEDGEEDLDDAGPRTRQRCAMGIVKEGSFDQMAIEDAEGRYRSGDDEGFVH